MSYQLKTLVKVVFLAVSTICFYVSATFVLAQGRPAAVNIATIENKPLSPVSWTSGSVVSRNNSQIAAEVSGRLVMLAPLGQEVKQGDVIARIDDQTLQIQLQEETAKVANAKSRFAFLQSEVKRKTRLASQNLSAQTELEETTSDKEVAQGELIAAKARLAQIEQNLSFSQVKAPFDGLVTQRLSNLGEYINTGTPIIRLVEIHNLEASIYAPLTAYQFLKQTNKLAIQSALGTGMAPIKAIIPVADSRSHLMEVRLDMSGFDWPVGLDIKAAVASGETKEVLAAPRDSLVLRRNGTSVFILDDEEKAKQVFVQVGIGAGELVEVIGDLKPGDRVVIRGAERLNEGQPVSIKDNNDQLISGNKNN